jgi:hypothetical protein
MDATPEASRGFSRRTLLRGGLVTGLGAAVATVAVPALTGVAKAGVADYATPPGAGPQTPFTAFNAQQNWWWCPVCSSLFASNPTGENAGVCIGALNGHNSGGSWEYEVPYGNPAIASVQPKWNWCSACDTLFYAPNIKNSHCGARIQDGPPVNVLPHLAGAWNYNLPFGGWVAGGPDLQGGWTWCNHCQQLWYPPRGRNLCPYGILTGIQAGHSVGSTWNYQLFTPQTR